MTNLEAWRLITNEFESPEIFSESAFYWLMSAALQRRVWVQGKPDVNGRPPPWCIFPNIYMLLVGPSGIGKGRILREVKDKLSCWNDKGERISLASGKMNATGERAKTFCAMSPSSITSAKLIKDVQHSALRSFTFEYKGTKKKYPHSSYCILSEELGSLFRNIGDTQDLSNFLLEGYDSGEYDKATNVDGHIGIGNICLSMLAGTTPVWLKTHIGPEALSDGVASRCMFIYSSKPNVLKLFSTYTHETALAQEQIRLHVRRLFDLYGEVKFSEEAIKIMTDWYEDPEKARIVNKSPKMVSYYGRHKTHLWKIALAIHFSERTDMVISAADIRNTIEYLKIAEKDMHLALDFGSSLHDTTDLQNDIIETVKFKGKMSMKTLIWKYRSHGFDRVRKTISDLKHVRILSSHLVNKEEFISYNETIAKQLNYERKEYNSLGIEGGIETST